MAGRQFAVIHVDKAKGMGATKLGNHIDRVTIPKNADPERERFNFHLMDRSISLTDTLKERIKTAKCKVRSNSTTHLKFILSGSHDRMKEMNKTKDIEKWFKKNLKWMQEKYGKENIIRFTLHRDERTPHIHAVVTPITKDNRLSARDILGGPADMKNLVTEYAEQMAEFGLSRGVKGSRAKHDTLQEYYGRILKPVETFKELPRQNTLESGTKYRERLKNELNEVILAHTDVVNERKRSKYEVQRSLEILKVAKEKEEKVRSQQQLLIKNTEKILEKGAQQEREKIERALRKRGEDRGRGI